MTHDLDGWLIDQVAQPVADLLGRVTGRTCHWWAAQLMVGVVAGDLFCAGFMAARPNVGSLISAFAGLCVAVFYAAMYFALIKFDGTFGAIPIWRIAHRHLRLISLVITCFIAAPGIIIVADGVFWWGILNLATDVISIVALYLAACVAMRPPLRLAYNLVSQ